MNTPREEERKRRRDGGYGRGRIGKRDDATRARPPIVRPHAERPADAGRAVARERAGTRGGVVGGNHAAARVVGARARRCGASGALRSAVRTARATTG